MVVEVPNVDLWYEFHMCHLDLIYVILLMSNQVQSGARVCSRLVSLSILLVARARRA